MIRVKQKILLVVFVMVVCLSVFGFGSTVHAESRRLSIPDYKSNINYGTIPTDSNQNLCIGILGGSTYVNTQTILWACNGNADQTWIATSFVVNGKHYTRLTNQKSNLCLGFQFAPKQGYLALQVVCTNNPDQAWQTRLSSVGVLTIQNVQSGLCLGVDHGDVVQGRNPIVWACNGNPDQRWRDLIDGMA